MEKSEKKQVEWYNEPSTITNLLLGVILVNVLSVSTEVAHKLTAAAIRVIGQGNRAMRTGYYVSALVTAYLT